MKQEKWKRTCDVSYTVYWFSVEVVSVFVFLVFSSMQGEGPMAGFIVSCP